MRKKSSVAILCALAAGFVSACIIGGVSGDDLLLAAGAGGALICLMLIPAFYHRTIKVQKMMQKKDALVIWEYTNDEAEEIAAQQSRIILRKSIWISLLISVCLGVVFLPLYIISLEQNSGLPDMLPIALPCVAVPWLSLIIAPFSVRRTIRGYKCKTIIGRDYILVSNRYIGVNDRHNLKAVDTRTEASVNGAMSKLFVRYSFMGLRITTLFHLWVEVPVPRGKEKEAEELTV